MYLKTAPKPAFPAGTPVTVTAGPLTGTTLRVVDNIIHANCLLPYVEVHVEDGHGNIFRCLEALLTEA